MLLSKTVVSMVCYDLSRLRSRQVNIRLESRSTHLDKSQHTDYCSKNNIRGDVDHAQLVRLLRFFRCESDGFSFIAFSKGFFWVVDCRTLQLCGHPSNTKNPFRATKI